MIVSDNRAGRTTNDNETVTSSASIINHQHYVKLVERVVFFDHQCSYEGQACCPGPYSQYGGWAEDVRVRGTYSYLISSD